MTYAALRFYFRRHQRRIEEDKEKTAKAEREEAAKKEARKSVSSAPELRLDPEEEIVTKEDLARAQIISTSTLAGGYDSHSASFDSSDSPSRDPTDVDHLEEEEEEEEETLEASGFEDDDFDGSRVSEDADRSSLDISLPDIPREGAASILSPTEAEVLVDYLAGGSVKGRIQCLVTIANAASFSANQYLLRRAGCIPVLNDLVLNEDQVVSGHAMKALTNLAVNEENQEHMEETVVILVSLIGKFHRVNNFELRRQNLKAELSALITLTNLCVTNKFHALVATLISGLLQNVDDRDQLGEFSPNVLTQTWKILVNLSSNALLLPSLLAAQCPKTFLNFLAETGEQRDSSNGLRICYFLANIMDAHNKDTLSPPSGATHSSKNTSASLPTAFSPDSVYSLLCLEEKSSELRSLLLDLTRHADDNIRQQSTRLYTAIFLFWGRKMSQNDGTRKSSPL